MAVRPALAVQICTPFEPPPSAQSRTSCSRQGQLELIFNFQAHSRGASVRQVELVTIAHSGMLDWHCGVPVHEIPPQCSVPTDDVPFPHCVRARRSGMANRSVTSERKREERGVVGIAINQITRNRVRT